MTDKIDVWHKTNSLDPVVWIAVFKLDGSKNVDAIQVRTTAAPPLAAAGMAAPTSSRHGCPDQQQARLARLTPSSVHSVEHAHHAAMRLQVRFASGAYEELGSPDALMSETPAAAMALPVGDPIKELALWTDPSTSVVQASIVPGLSLSHPTTTRASAPAFDQRTSCG